MAPLGMPCIGGDVGGRHLLVGDADRLGTDVLVQYAAHRQAGPGGRGGDEVDDGEATDERLAAPSLGDMAEHPMLYLVPLCAVETYAERSNAQEPYGSCLKDDGWPIDVDFQE